MKRAWLIALLYCSSVPLARGAVRPAQHGTPPVTHPGHIRESSAIRALIGEANNQSDQTMLAVAGALRNRGTLQGVYGLTNTAAVHASAHELRRAKRIWRSSLTTRLTSAKYFGCPADADYFLNSLHYHPIARYGAITFYQP